MNRRRFLATTGVAASGLLSGCLSMLPWLDSDTPLPDDPTGTWTQYGANKANTFATNVSAPPRGNLAWTSEAFTRWRPAVSDQTVYTTNFDPSNDGSVIALDAKDGTEQWRTTLNASGDNVTVIVDDRCIVAHDEELVALDTQTGERLWAESINGFKQVVTDEATGKVLIASTRGIETFQAADGERRWETDTVRHLVHAPVVYDGRVFAVGDVEGSPSLAAFSLQDGSDRWQTELTAIPESAAPVATQDGVVVSNDRTLVVYDRETGEQQREIGSFGEDDDVVPHTVAVDDGTVFVTSSYGAVAVDSETGTVRWHRETPVYEPGICVGIDTVIFPISNPEFATEKKTISAFDRRSGEMRWFYWFDPGFHHKVTSRPVLVDGAVFFTATHIDGLGAIGDVPERDG